MSEDLKNIKGDEAKRIVGAGLERRREARQEAEQEATLEQFEQDMIEACNQNCADAKEQHRTDDANRLSQKQREERAAARRAAMAAEAAKEMAATKAVQHYGVACLVILLVSACSRFPFWAAVTLICGLAVFPTAYIFRLYYPLKGEKKNVQQ